MRDLLIAICLSCSILACGAGDYPEVGQLNEAEKELLLAASELVPMGLPTPIAPTGEQWRALTYADGSRELEYLYNTFHTSSQDPVYITTSLSIYPKEKSARLMYRAKSAAFAWELNKPLVGLFDENHLERTTISCDYADACRLTFLVKRDKRVGSVFYLLKGRYLYIVAMVGWRFLDAEKCHELIRPKVAQFSALDDGDG